MQRNLRPGVLLQGPGSSPASVSTWKPLQMPTTGPPAAAKLGHGVHDRREAGDGARAQVVAVGEATGHDDRVDAAAAVGRRATAARPRRRGRATASTHVELAVRAREEHDADRAAIRSPASATRGQRRSSRPRSRGWSGTAGRARRPGRGRWPRRAASTRKRMALPTRTPRTPSKPSAGSDRSMVAPCGSAIPGAEVGPRRARRSSMRVMRRTRRRAVTAARSASAPRPGQSAKRRPVMRS